MRISQDRAREGLAVKRQLDDCRALAKRLGWAVAEFVDDDISAYSGKARLGYRAMLEGAAEAAALADAVAQRLATPERRCSR